MRIIVAGAGVTGYLLLKMLVAKKHDVVVIDVDREVCEEVYAETGAMTIHGSATDIKILQKSGMQNADVVLCLVRYDSDNIAISALAKSLGVKSIIALLRKPEYAPAYKSAGVTTIISLTDLLLHQLMMEIEQPNVKSIMPLGGGKAEIYAVEVPPGAKSIGMTVREITEQRGFPKECVFVGIYHEDSDIFCIPRGDHDLKEWDTIFLVSNSQYIKPATDFLTKS
ncbi:MAG: TrkA family potassium uptake protein [Deltaproteobacteria bacterium]|nr:TrkA family potassium uptake protein [Deltaproteobacteria bacterium]MDH3774532.1 TrkA family potassium uptake protein [Deltaproteobacteria bacterium]MDH3803413.1 TrkA family potassium uptake protein [Deltaproteobacteria bacterium]MDH3951772.1 TrkA family potassium uptake protein [Deltaproteobacteria bacterium]PNV86464.1 MAG: potassium transporter TrkA [Desulfobacteraceae bacterium]